MMEARLGDGCTTADSVAAQPGLGLTFDANPLPMWVYDRETLRFLAVNDAAIVKYGFGRDEFLAMTVCDLRPAGDVPGLLAALAARAFDQVELGDATWRHQTREGHLIHVEVASSPVTWQGRSASLVLARDVTEQRAALQAIRDREAALTHLAMYDALTGLANRTRFTERLEEALNSRQETGGVVAVLFLDVDRVKAVNDSLGHVAGDQLLLEVAARLQAEAPASATIGRFGGDEFVVVCPGLAGPADALDLAERLRRTLSRPATVAGHEVRTSASIGVAVSGTASELLSDADTAMYDAKTSGRNRCALFDPASRRRRQDWLQRAADLQAAIGLGELRVVYQTEVDLADERVVGVEALVRWQHPTLGLLPPSEFITVAEETGLIVEVGEWVLWEACRQLAPGTGAFGNGDFSISVNLSARQLSNPAFVETVRSVLSATGVAPHRLCLEITETVLMDDIDGSVEALRALKALGIRLAIDDFGTGYSSLSYLRRFPVDIVKVDRSFIAALGGHSPATAIVAAVVNLAHALGLSVIAEGVETEEQLMVLRALQCDRAQGFYWSRPKPVAEVCLESGRAGAEDPQPIDLRAILVERTDAVRAATGRSVVFQSPPVLASVFAEAGVVASIVDQLLTNAVKFSDSDKPIVVSAAAEKRWVRVSVADYGIGMTPADAARCFEQFWRAAPGSGGRREGTGLGLSIVRSLVDAFGGHVAVKTAPDRGATFTFALPRSQRAAERRPGQGTGEDSSIREFMRQIGVPIRSPR